MSLRSPLRVVVRLAVIASVALSGVTFGADDAEARRGGKVRSSNSHSQSHDGAKHHEGSDAARKSGHAEDGSPGASYVPGVRVRSRESSRTTDTATDAGPASARGLSLVPAAGSGSAANADSDVPGCAIGMMCTVCLAGCDGSINGIVDAQMKTPELKRRE